MGIFSEKESCNICNEDKGKIKIKDGHVCKNCLKACGEFLSNKIDIKDRHKSEINRAIEKNKMNEVKLAAFKETKKLGTFIEIDEINQEWVILDGFGKKKSSSIIYDYSDLRGYELIEDDVTLTKGSSDVPGSGEVVGDKSRTFIRNLKLIVYINDSSNPDISITLVSTELNINSNMYSSIYKSANEIIEFFQGILRGYSEKIEEVNKVEAAALDASITDDDISLVDELIKLEGLLDRGSITEDEFNNLKTVLLKF
ncbi:hypothetical protein ACQPU1_08695 [Clostridium paraputrificum]|uniref:hypothetical protein n=1 Tax=Clostridium TaxID=1485 RepID=UPI003D33991D